jgi:hypothetical protein
MVNAGLTRGVVGFPMYLSPKLLVLPLGALAVIIALGQAHSQNPRSAVAAPTVYRVTNCATPTNTITAACAIAVKDSATIMR